jgi:hypothetical protein
MVALEIGRSLTCETDIRYSEVSISRKANDSINCSAGGEGRHACNGGRAVETNEAVRNDSRSNAKHKDGKLSQRSFSFNYISAITRANRRMICDNGNVTTPMVRSLHHIQGWIGRPTEQTKPQSHMQKWDRRAQLVLF